MSDLISDVGEEVVAGQGALRVGSIYWRVELPSRFWIGYCQSVRGGRAQPHFEYHPDTAPVVVTARLRDRPIEELIATYQRVLDQQLRLTSPVRRELFCVALGRAMDDHVRLHFPYCQTTLADQRAFSSQVSSQWTGLLAPVSVETPLYGSDDYQILGVWGAGLGDDQPPRLRLTDLVDRRTLLASSQLSSLAYDSEPVEYWLPIVLSITYLPTIVPPARVVPLPGADDAALLENEVGNMVLAEFLSRLISPDRYELETSWLDVGRALHHTSEGAEIGLDTWVRVSRDMLGELRPSFLGDEKLEVMARSRYSSFTGIIITIKTLAWYARADNGRRYQAWYRQWCAASMETALSCLDVDVARCIYRCYWLSYVCVSYRNKQWYEFDNHRWRETSAGVSILTELSTTFVARFEASRTELNEALRRSTDDAFRVRSEIVLGQMNKLIGYLKTLRTKSIYLHSAAELFHNDQFLDRLDTNAELTGVGNGIIDISLGYAQFRAAKPEDYISMGTSVPYQSHYDHDHPLVLELTTWFHRAFPDDELYRHFLKFAASCFRGKNSDKLFSIWTGEGDNSKSTVIKLFEATWKSLCIKFSVNVLTERHANAGNASPHLARARGTRIAFFDEPDEKLPINKAIIKRLTGGDSFFARRLHENGGDVAATNKTVMVANRLPPITTPDKATINRVSVIPYISTWSKEAPVSLEEQLETRVFPLDPNFEQRLPQLAPAFLWLSAQNYPDYLKYGLVPPAIVVKHTEEYWSTNDIYAHFSEERIQQLPVLPDTTEAQRPFIGLTPIYREFKSWFKDSYPGIRMQPNKIEVRDALAKRWGPLVGGGWHYRQIKIEDGCSGLPGQERF